MGFDKVVRDLLKDTSRIVFDRFRQGLAQRNSFGIKMKSWNIFFVSMNRECFDEKNIIRSTQSFFTASELNEVSNS